MVLETTARAKRLGHRKVGATHVDSRAHKRFAECGFSIRATAGLIKAGIDAPERLLSMTPDRIELIPGIGPTLMKEIEEYRARATGTV
jgi:hypothetical protein